MTGMIGIFCSRHRRISGAEVHVNPGDLRLIVGEIIPGKIELPVGTDLLPSDQLRQHVLHLPGGFRRVHQGQCEVLPKRLYGTAVEGRRALGRLRHQGIDPFPVLRRDVPGGALQHRLLCDDVVAVAGGELPDADDHRLHRGAHAGHEGLHRHHDLTADIEGIHALIGLADMGSLPPDPDGEVVHTGIVDARLHAEDAGMQVRCCMNTENPLGPAQGLLPRILTAEALRAGADFLCRLEEKTHRAGKLVPPGGEKLRGPQQGCRMHIVAAGMHSARLQRTVSDNIILRHRERVNIRPQRNFGFSRLISVQYADDTGFRHPEAVDVELPELLLDAVRGAMLLKGDFRMLVKVPAQGTDIVQVLLCR